MSNVNGNSAPVLSAKESRLRDRVQKLRKLMNTELWSAWEDLLMSEKDLLWTLNVLAKTDAERAAIAGQMKELDRLSDLPHREVSRYDKQQETS